MKELWAKKVINKDKKFSEVPETRKNAVKAILVQKQKNDEITENELKELLEN